MRRQLDDHLGAGLEFIRRPEVTQYTAASGDGNCRAGRTTRKPECHRYRCDITGFAVIVSDGGLVMTFIKKAIERAEHLAQVIVNPVAVGVGEHALVGQHTDPVCDSVQVHPAGS